MAEIVASYNVRIALHRHETPEDDLIEIKAEPLAPTNARLEQLIQEALYQDLDYYYVGDIGVSSVRTDK